MCRLGPSIPSEVVSVNSSMTQKIAPPFTPTGIQDDHLTLPLCPSGVLPVRVVNSLCLLEIRLCSGKRNVSDANVRPNVSFRSTELAIHRGKEVVNP